MCECITDIKQNFKLRICFVSFSVSSTDLLQFNDLQILEIRSTGSNRNLLFFIDDAIPTLKHLNFESIKLMADEKMKKQIKHQHPSETYDYVPEGSRYAYKKVNPDDIFDADSMDEADDDAEEIEIVPYHVYKMELSKSMRPNFFGWTNLEVMRIHNCHFDELEWEMFAGLERLQHLSLEHNDIKVIPAFAFYGAMHLKTLSLAHNDILDLHYLALAGLLDLEHLDLSQNNLTKLSEATFPPFPQMNTFDLRENPIEFILPMTFAILNTTKELLMGSTSTALDLANAHEAFIALDQLKLLRILNVRATSLHQSLFVGLKSVERFHLKGSTERIDYDAFAEIPNLKELILSNCNISDISMDAFFGVKKLQIIDLASNQLTEIPHGLFDEQKQLHEIYLQNNRLRKLPANFFTFTSTLKLVRLIDNDWRCSCDMLNWNQAITNSIRLNKLTGVDQADNCIRNPKTGRIDYCNSEYNDFPQFAYGYDSKMSPLCNENATAMATPTKLKNVYYVLRHSIKCASATGDDSQSNLLVQKKQRSTNRFMAPLNQLSESEQQKFNNDENNEIAWRQPPSSQLEWSSKKNRKLHFDNKVKRTMSQNAQIHHERFQSNDVIVDDDL